MEVYGTKPPRFTKEWWEYFWDYYKWHTIGTVIVLIIIVTTIVDSVNKVKYDLSTTFIAPIILTEETEQALTNLMEDNIDDASGNKKNEAFLTYLNMSDNSDPQYMQAMQTKLMIELGYSESFVYILSKQYADLFEGGEGVLIPASDWTSKESYDGSFVSLNGNRYLEDLGLDTSDLYLAVRDTRKDEKDDKFCIEKQKNGVKFAKFLIN